MANSHPGSYCGQDAYSDMFVTENRHVSKLGWQRDRSDIDTEQCEWWAEDARQRKFQCDYRGGTDLETVVRRLTPLECNRLQGFPEKKEWNVENMTKDEFIALNLAAGNLIVDAEKGKIFRTRGPGGNKLNQPAELKGADVNGYLASNITLDGKKFQCRHHRIVWISQNGVVPDGYVIDHINNDKKDNRIGNLQLLTSEENSTKAAKDGLYLTGKDNPAAKLDPELKEEIAFVYKYSDYTQRQLAEIYGISKSRINQIIKEVSWVDIGDWVDEKGKLHKESDSAKYKALGNSIAQPYWFYLLRRISAQYERPATMGSLFSGIGGFDLAWTRCNGTGTVLWSSEIESFPIAVMKKHFGDEETGIEGDIGEYL